MDPVPSAPPKKKPLKNPCCNSATASMFGNIIAGKEYDKEGAKKYYEAMATDIRNEKKRIGGNFSIAHVLLTREMRDNVRRILGPDVIFILLRMSPEDRRKRVLMRHKGDENVTQMMDVSIFDVIASLD